MDSHGGESAARFLLQAALPSMRHAGLRPVERGSEASPSAGGSTSGADDSDSEDTMPIFSNIDWAGSELPQGPSSPPCNKQLNSIPLNATAPCGTLPNPGPSHSDTWHRCSSSRASEAQDRWTVPAQAGSAAGQAPSEPAARSSLACDTALPLPRDERAWQPAAQMQEQANAGEACGSWLTGAAGRLSRLESPRRPQVDLSGACWDAEVSPRPGSSHHAAAASLSAGPTSGASHTAAAAAGGGTAEEDEAAWKAQEAQLTLNFHESLRTHRQSDMGTAGLAATGSCGVVLDDVAGVSMGDLDALIARLQAGAVLLDLAASRPSDLPDPAALFSDDEEEQQQFEPQPRPARPAAAACAAPPSACMAPPSAATVSALHAHGDARTQASSDMACEHAHQPAAAQPSHAASQHPAGVNQAALPPRLQALARLPAAAAAPAPAHLQPTPPASGMPAGLPPRFRGLPAMPAPVGQDQQGQQGGQAPAVESKQQQQQSQGWSSSLQDAGSADQRPTVVVDLRQQQQQAARRPAAGGTTAQGRADAEQRQVANAATVASAAGSLLRNAISATEAKAGAAPARPTSRSTFVSCSFAGSDSTQSHQAASSHVQQQQQVVLEGCVQGEASAVHRSQEAQPHVPQAQPSQHAARTQHGARRHARASSSSEDDGDEQLLRQQRQQLRERHAPSSPAPVTASAGRSVEHARCGDDSSEEEQEAGLQGASPAHSAAARQHYGLPAHAPGVLVAPGTKLVVAGARIPVLAAAPPPRSPTATCSTMCDACVGDDESGEWSSPEPATCDGTTQVATAGQAMRAASCAADVAASPDGHTATAPLTSSMGAQCEAQALVGRPVAGQLMGRSRKAAASSKEGGAAAGGADDVLQQDRGWLLGVVPA